MRAFEHVASLFVVVGVALMIFGSSLMDSRGGLWPFILYSLGVVLLTFGVRLAIDLGKASR